MKFSLFSLFAVGAGLAIQHVSAAPIRVVVVTGPQVLPAIPDVAVKHDAQVADVPKGPSRRPCRMREKAVSLSNTFRQALGMPLIEVHASSGNNNPSVPNAWPFIGTPHVDSENAVERHPHHKHPHHNMRHHRHCRSFLRRVHQALMALGPWEGRAVAFVLGCGIGVLLRMAWVMTVVTYRMIRGSSDDSGEYALVYEAEEILVPPPQYTYEKLEAAQVIPVPVQVPVEEKAPMTN